MSRRCRGITINCVLKPVTQASPFSVEDLKQLLGHVLRPLDVWDAIFCGAVLLAVYSRSRWADMQYAEALSLDRDASGRVVFIDLQTARRKTMMAKQHRHKFLTMTAPAQGVSPDSWVEAWLGVCSQVGFVPCDGWPVMPAPDEHGRPTVRALSSAEASAWIRHLLGNDKVDDRRLSSHSCKCTLLSMLSKFGASVDVRACLGYHVGKNQTVFTYSREAAAGPLRVLQDMLTAIQRGEFRPDETRSGRFVTSDHLAWEQTREERDWYPEMGPLASELVTEGDLQSLAEPDPAEVPPREEVQEPVPEPPWLELGDPVADSPRPLDSSELDTALVNGEPVDPPTFGGNPSLVQESSSSGEDGSESSTESTSSNDAEVPLNVVQVPVAPDGTKFLRRKKSRMCHLLRDGDVRRLLCGRAVSDFYIPAGLILLHSGGSDSSTFRRV